MKIITKNENFKIPTDLEVNSFIKSLYEQSLDKELTVKQIVALKSILNIELESPIYKTKIIKQYKKYYYRTDYHGDYLQDCDFVYDVDESDLEKVIQDAHAGQYSYEKYIKEYSFVKDVEIPSVITNIKYFMDELYEDYVAIANEIKRNKFRKTKTKNDAIYALNSILDCNADIELINKVLGKKYKY